MAPPDFRAELRKQLGFIASSSDLYDAGNHAEAIRIGTSIRVLIHDTTNSTSLLTHLGAKDSIRLLSTCPGLLRPHPHEPPGMTPVFAFGLGQFALGATGTHHIPRLDQARTADLLAVQDWWTQVVWILDAHTFLTRKDIVLTAANKDGGAHVHGDLPAAYERLVRGPLDSFVRAKGESPADTHLVSLRQLGYELLNSNELTDLQ